MVDRTECVKKTQPQQTEMRHRRRRTIKVLRVHLEKSTRQRPSHVGSDGIGTETPVHAHDTGSREAALA